MGLWDLVNGAAQAVNEAVTSVSAEVNKEQEIKNIQNESDCDDLVQQGIRYHFKETLKETGEPVTDEFVSAILNSIDTKELFIILEELEAGNPKTAQELQVLKKNSQFAYQPLLLGVAEGMFLYNNPFSKQSLKERLSECEGVTENIIAIKKLVAELEDSYMPLVKLDQQFIEELFEERPLVVLIMLTRPKLREYLLTHFEEELEDYVEDEEIYKQLVPYIQIYDSGKTHDKWRHLADSKKKTCVVLYMRDCKVASSKNTAVSYEREPFLVLEGLSVHAEKDSAEVHYLEV